MQQIIDISVPLSPDTTVWDDDPPIQLERIAEMAKGDAYNLTRLCMSVHNGTHVDAPNHFVEDGITVECLSWEALIGPVQVLAIPADVKVITAHHLRQNNFSAQIPRVLLKTANSSFWKTNPHVFQSDYVYLAADAAQLLIDNRVKLVGIDYLSISSVEDMVPVHQQLLSAGIVILETIDLTSVQPGIYTLYCLPLKLVGTEGAPVRAILIKD